MSTCECGCGYELGEPKRPDRPARFKQGHATRKFTDRPLNARSPEYRRRFVVAQYGLTMEDYELLLKKQGGVCAICQAPPGKYKLAVDHDHRCCPGEKRSCGKCVRGLLCFKCNTLLASFDDREKMARIIQYLGGDF